MRNLWLVARHEYLQMVRKRSFLLSTIGIPVLFAVFMGIAILTGTTSSGSAAPIGYVDLAGVLTEAPAAEEDESDVEVFRYADLDAGRAAVEAGEIQALFVVPEDYLAQPQVDVYVLDEPESERAWAAWNEHVRRGLVAGLPEGIRERAEEGPEVTMRSADGSRVLAAGDVAGVIMPIVTAILFMLTSMMSSGYLLQAVVSEKENRTMEIMATSVTPTQMIGGKTAGLMAVTLTQLGLWILTIGVGLAIALPFIEDAPVIRMPWGLLGMVLVYFLPAYGLLAGMMIAVGGAVDEARHGQAVSGPLTLPFVLPIMLMPVMLSNPGGAVAVALTLFPITSFLTVTLRMGLAQVPFWQMVASWALLAASAALAIWLAGRIFRLGMLRYGQRLELRQILAALRDERSAAVEA
jgi:ABC-2 type transport system permease protein